MKTLLKTDMLSMSHKDEGAWVQAWGREWREVGCLLGTIFMRCMKSFIFILVGKYEESSLSTSEGQMMRVRQKSRKG